VVTDGSVIIDRRVPVLPKSNGRDGLFAPTDIARRSRNVDLKLFEASIRSASSILINVRIHDGRTSY
jgi:hypothetical protein